MDRIFLYKKTTATLLILTILISAFLSACRTTDGGELSGSVDTVYESKTIVLDNTNSSDVVSDDSVSSAEDNTSKPATSSKDTVSEEKPTSNIDIVITGGSAYQSDNTDPDGIALSEKNTFTVNTKSTGKTVTSFFNNMNMWSVNAPSKDSQYDVYDFVDYVQLMQCSGGTADRDLFKDPLNKSVLDDYDFTKLINVCRTIVKNGAKPHLKLGSVPLKYSTNVAMGDFNMNIYPPDDYNVYYDYIYALAAALVDEFGRGEVLSWRFGVMTEYENDGWFMHPSGDPEETKIAYFKLYDYTVQALIDAVGDTIFVGAHSMSCTEGMWDEADFIEHVAQGTNYATGKKGTRICYLAASYYQHVAGAGVGKNEKNFIQTMSYLQQTAKKYGLNDLIYGVDEGRMLTGINTGRTSFDLNNRMVGYSYQGAFDARLFKQAVENNIGYFSSWMFLSKGRPTVSYYVAKYSSEFAGMKQVSTVKQTTSSRDADIQAISAYDPATKTLRIMAYNFKNSYEYSDKATVSFGIDAPIQSGNVSVTKRFIDDNCNYFDEWLQDRKTYNITDDMFHWSPDDPGIEVFLEAADDELADIYYKTLMPRYIEASKLTPQTETLKVSAGKLNIEDTIDGNSVVFYEIKF